jgi:lysophospholipase L1-like esterase
MTSTRRSVLEGMAATGFAAVTAGPSIGYSASQAAFKIVMLGDSLTEGYGLPASQSVPVRLQAALNARVCPFEW